MSLSADRRLEAVNAAALANAGRGLNAPQLVQFAQQLLRYIEEGAS